MIIKESSTDRYAVVPPVAGGYAFWNVIDLKSDIMPNFAVAVFSIELSTAGEEALALADRLNCQSK